MRTAAPETTTPESTAETLALLALASTGRTPENLVRIRGTWVDRPVTSAADRERARAMADYRAQAVIDHFVEVEITWPTWCGVCPDRLLPGDVAWEDERDEGNGPKLCTDCKADEEDAAKGILR